MLSADVMLVKNKKRISINGTSVHPFQMTMHNVGKSVCVCGIYMWSPCKQWLYTSLFLCNSVCVCVNALKNCIRMPWVCEGGGDHSSLTHATWPIQSVCVCVRARLQSVAAETVLHRGVREHHVGVTEHVQTIQAQGLDAQLILQWEAHLRVETVSHVAGRHGTADVLGMTGVGVIYVTGRKRGNGQQREDKERRKRK